jgi:hypothetical protein
MPVSRFVCRHWPESSATGAPDAGVDHLRRQDRCRQRVGGFCGAVSTGQRRLGLVVAMPLRRATLPRLSGPRCGGLRRDRARTRAGAPPAVRRRRRGGVCRAPGALTRRAQPRGRGLSSAAQARDRSPPRSTPAIDPAARGNSGTLAEGRVLASGACSAERFDLGGMRVA